MIYASAIGDECVSLMRTSVWPFQLAVRTRSCFFCDGSAPCSSSTLTTSAWPLPLASSKASLLASDEHAAPRDSRYCTNERRAVGVWPALVSRGPADEHYLSTIYLH